MRFFNKAHENTIWQGHPIEQVNAMKGALERFKE